MADEEQAKLLETLEEQRKVLDTIANDIVENVLKKIPYKKIDENLFMRVVSCSYNVLDTYKDKNEIFDYVVECGYMNNTMETINNGELHCRIGIAFTVADILPGLMKYIDCAIRPTTEEERKEEKQ